MLHHQKPHQSGGALLLTLIMLLVAVIIGTASVRFIASQSTRTVLQEQEEQAFAIADAGINYTAWLLSAAGGNFTPTALVASPPSSATNHSVTEQPNVPVGEFDLIFGPACGDSLGVRSIGYDQARPELCQVIDATLRRFASEEYKITQWDHLVGYPCNQAYVPPSPGACASPTPIPTLTPTPTPSPIPTPSPTPLCMPGNCPAGWVCGDSGACEPTTCPDLTSCQSGFVACPPDQFVGGCDAFYNYQRWWHFECCPECNEPLQNFCNIQGGYCVATEYNLPCPTPIPTPTPTPTPAFTTPPITPTPTPTFFASQVDIKANTSDEPIYIPSGTAATLSWTSNFPNCEAWSSPTSQSWTGARATEGTESTGNLTTQMIFYISCTGATDSVTINVFTPTSTPSPTPTPFCGTSGMTCEVNATCCSKVCSTGFCQ